MEKISAIIENEKLAYRIAFILIFMWGIAMSFLVPSWQTPDEMAHLNMIGASLGVDHLMETFLDDMNLENDRIRSHYEEKIDTELWEDVMTKAPDYGRADCLPQSIHSAIIKYLPAAIGIELGVLLHLPTFWALTMGELFALAFYVSICALALRLMPYKKEVFLMLMSFPMCLQQAASISYDSVLLPLCFLYIAYIFHLRMMKEQVGWSDLIKAMLLLLIITYIKIPYVFLILLIFLIPKEKIYLKVGKLEIDGEFIRKWRVLLLLAAFVLCAIGVFLLRNNYWVRLVTGLILEFPRTAYLFLATAYYWGEFLLNSSVGQFGWLDSKLPFAFVLFTYAWLLLVSIWGEKERENFGLKHGTRIWIWFAFFILSVFILFSMVNHTVTITLYGVETTSINYNIREAVYQIPYIGGLQGRYFLPFLALPFLALPTWKKAVKGKAWLVVLFQVSAIVMTILILHRRYWLG